jgi:hypothetical protein
MARQSKTVTFSLYFHEEEDGPDPLAHAHALFARGECEGCEDPFSKFMTDAYWEHLEKRMQARDEWDAMTPEERADGLGITEKLQQWAASGAPGVIRHENDEEVVFDDDGQFHIVPDGPDDRSD